MYDVKGRHDLVTWGWTKLGAYARSNTSIIRLLECSFWVNMTLVCCLCLCSQHYIIVHAELGDFLRLWRQLKQQRTLGYSTTSHEISCHSAHQVPYLMLLEFTTPVYLGTYSCCSQQFLCHRSYACTCLDHELRLCGLDSMHAHAQLSCVYLVSTLDVTHVIKCARLSPTLTGRAWEQG